MESDAQDEMILLVDYVAAHESLLPTVGRDALDAARNFWRSPTSGAADELSLLGSRVRAFLSEKHGDSTTIADNQDRALRALLSVLHPHATEEWAAEASEWVYEMTDAIGASPKD